MAKAASDPSALKDAIVGAWTPAVGVQSLSTLWIENILQISEDLTNNSRLLPPLDYILLFLMYEMPVIFGLGKNISNYFDNQGPFQLDNAMVSGSWSEGLFIYSDMESSAKLALPDVDFMCILKNIKFTTNDQLCGNLTVKEDTPFVNAYVRDGEAAKLWKDFLHSPCDLHHSSSRHQLSSFKLKEKLAQNGANTSGIPFYCYSDETQFCVHSEPGSAALTVDIADKLDDGFNAVGERIFKKLFHKLLLSCDIVLALSCDGWPLCAKEWITRKRIWPNKYLVEEITLQHGFHIVPKSSPQGDFRLSFSSAETTLIKHLLPLQHKVLRSFKAVVKYHQHTWSPIIKDIIKTYHLKTIAFWHFEKTSQDSYTEETVVTHLVLMLQELAEALRKQELPMYFMPKFNLLKSLDNYEEVIDIVEKIIMLSTNYAAATQAVATLATLNRQSFALEIMEDICIAWEKEIKRSEGEPKSQHDDLPYMSTVLFLGKTLMQFAVNQNDEHRDPENMRNDLMEKLKKKFLSLFNNSR